MRDNTLILSDNGGRSLYFEHLFPGEDGYSRSESLWLVRGGVAKLDEGHRLAALWQALPEELRLSPHRYLAQTVRRGRGGCSAGVSGCRKRMRCCLRRCRRTGY
ncbi:protein rhsC domain protein [Shigella dysenteriae 155-74]|nr:protein rhsC domain protein [Shigella dysenteriae 155-74]